VASFHWKRRAHVVPSVQVDFSTQDCARRISIPTGRRKCHIRLKVRNGGAK